ncbi:hypothetical protein AYR62_12935 [Secundilactobacillus paracollinoides]|uniref:HTH tetR-type domain-containing protein n=1 Tax=Secundilactobacillus paracollinoides TaxID=240427 RepID=A0A1B2IWF7_9LACO|nr:TetR/AcrR family transcriptional regulator [Secundilactobacillus paracollinoides]ANZ60601.1 hypothetical protein AYR61_04075 [Secundilactobacillus paracollinoides]ANZ64890.1 hypothetical protein AYR62_12935 [Secundilactobacillus paracollinoides]ANZ66406.1 hypothetical protein AYR63_04155 [Secundilactobacillus paracollinoides]KRL80959.1 hypothetical protein FC17_GL002773 [Secundilactobacillus paracollinoides DSM 15502 = JCM 11969]
MPIAKSKAYHREQMVHRLLPVIRVTGFHDMTLQKIVTRAHVSKVTFYKYFESFDDLVAQIVSDLVDYLQEEEFPTQVTQENYLSAFQHISLKTFELSAFISLRFQTDLAADYPELANQLERAILTREQALTAFYEQGRTLGIVADVDIAMVVYRDRQMVPALVDRHIGDTADQVAEMMRDYMVLTARELLATKYLEQFPLTDFETQVAALSEKIQDSYQAL